MNPSNLTHRRLGLLALAAALAGCTSPGSLLSGEKLDYHSGAAKTRPLEVPPDLTQLARDPRYAPQGGVVSASTVQGAPPAGTAAALQQTSAIAPTLMGKARIERRGNQRWLVIDSTPPETVWPDVRAFWLERGFTLTVDNPQAGVLETDWAENRAKLPNDLIRSTLGRLIDRVYDTGERDRFRTRVERSPSGATEIFITHRGLEEVYSSERRDHTIWIPRANDPQLEAEILTRLMVRLGAQEEKARTMVAAAPDTPARARVVSAAGALAALEVDEPFDRAWRRVGLALDRGGFSVEDRDRSAGVYFVRYIDPKLVAKEEPGFFARLFGAGNSDVKPTRYRVQVKGQGEKSVVSVLDASGAPETGDPGKSIVASLVRELR